MDKNYIQYCKSSVQQELQAVSHTGCKQILKSAKLILNNTKSRYYLNSTNGPIHFFILVS